jgi:hypothetical protein
MMIIFHNKYAGRTQETTAQANAGATENPEVSEVDRRLARAQRFGVDNEETKKVCDV